MEKRRFTWFMLLPSAIVFLALGVYPTIVALWTSLTSYSLTDPVSRKFVFLGNYLKLLTDTRFWTSLGHSLWFVGVSVFVSFVLGLGIALLLYRTKKFQGFFRIVFLVPMVIAPTITTLNFKFMYNYNLGIINRLLQVVGIPKL